MRPVFIKTFGCKVNYAESTAFADLLRDAGFAPLEVGSAELPGHDELEQPVVFVNGCCVTKEAERKAAQFVRRVRRLHPGAEVLFSGCAARNYATRKNYELAGARVFSFYPEAFEWVRQHVPPVQAFGTNDERGMMNVESESAEAGANGGGLADSRSVHHSSLITHHSVRSRAFLKVQDGCHNCCTFCIIPFVRPYASRPLPELLAEVERRLAEGMAELVLTGVNIGHYGATPIASVHEVASATHFRRSKLYEPTPGHPTLCDLIDAILARLARHEQDSGARCRLRISSIEPEDIEPRFFEQLAHPNMCPHLHLPLQSGSERVLAEMRRLYDLDTYLQRVESFRAACPDGALTTDVLVGFPGETAADFAATLEVCERAGFERIHGFPFSPRPGTRAAMLPQLPSGTAAERNRQLIAHCAPIADRRWQRFVGATEQVLVEQHDGECWHGYGSAYQQVRLATPADSGPAETHVADVDLTGRIVDAALTSYADGWFSATLASG